MPMPAKRKAYNIIYDDGTYQTYDLTAQDLKILFGCISNNEFAVLSDDLGLVTTHIRTVIKYVAPPEPPKLDSPTIPSELDDDSKEWIRENTSEFYRGEGRSFN